MQKSNLIRKGRKGFTLVEVALAVAVGLIVIGGAIVGFNAVRENASNSAARQKVDAAVGIVENLAAANNQIYPTSGLTAAGAAGESNFATTWKAQRTDWNANPWGGLVVDSDPTTGNGVTEQAAAAFGSATATVDTTVAANAMAAPAADAATQAGAGNIIYKTATAGSQWGFATDTSDGSPKVVKSYLVSLFDKNGVAYWTVKGGK